MEVTLEDARTGDNDAWIPVNFYIVSTNRWKSSSRTISDNREDNKMLILYVFVFLCVFE